MKPTIILIHGAYADSSSWNGVIEPMAADGHRVTWANPLRSIATDAAALTTSSAASTDRLVLAGHSCGGSVMTNVDHDAGDVVALVYVAGFALEAGESPGDASSLAPGSSSPRRSSECRSPTVAQTPCISYDKFHHQFAADLPAQEAR